MMSCKNQIACTGISMCFLLIKSTLNHKAGYTDVYINTSENGHTHQGLTN